MTARRRALVRGTVQGVGFRPFVFQLAHRLGLGGWVLNAPEGVTIEVEGDPPRLDEFFRRLRQDAPPLAHVAALRIDEVNPAGETEFVIRSSDAAARPQPVIPADVATCADCGREIGDPADRRHRYPFTNCTNCGPRYTIVQRIPYDRPNTTMAAFCMCPDCQAEYEDPTNRRFHAQPNACPVCGPRVALDGDDQLGTQAALGRVGEALRAGEVAAIKGLGGFHLACDARSDEAVVRLRDRKGRGLKPFAIMVRDLEEARRVCQVSELEERLLASPQSPIVIMPRRPEGGVSAEVAPNNATLGVMLPYTPLHRLLFEQSPPALVMTSGNLAEEPIAHHNDEAKEKLGHIADRFLTHNRDIHLPCDDSVARIADGQVMLLRRARGYTPRPIGLGFEAPPVLACGGEQKNTLCILVGDQAVLSQHIGDLDNVETLDYFQRVVRHFQALFEFEPQIVAHDLHPEYLSTKWAQALEGIRPEGVQHHHAHMAGVMGDNGLDGQAIAITFDGTGYGLDGAVWGGEFLVGSREQFRRAGHLRYVRLPGGEAGIRAPARMALSHLVDCFGQDGFEKAVRRLPSLSERDVEVIARLIESGLNSPWTSSMGRLFDTVSALLRVCERVTYEGQAAIELETLAAQARADQSDGDAYGFDAAPGTDGIEIDMRPVVAGIVADLERGVARELIALRFHETVAHMAVQTCRALADETGLDRVMVTGGVAQNMLLLERVLAGLRRVGLRPYLNRHVPCNDGGLSFGQALVAAARSDA